ncbi:hypothetical protein EVB98_045 [Rhizobium phage RHph_N3_2]|nr:hypothetical protein EVB98_045 [Rhizobium phage RHph_N3_2]
MEEKLAIIHQIRRNSDISSDGMSSLRQLANCNTTIDPSTRIRRAADSIATEMKKLHGGNWQAQIDHQRRLVMVWAIDQ